jgi:hypothetical protein
MAVYNHIWSKWTIFGGITMSDRPGEDQRRAHQSPLQGRILSEAVLRDIADLNSRYLEIVLEESVQDDPLVGWSREALGVLRGAERAVLARMAACPFALFQIELIASERGDREGVRVEDRSAAGENPGLGMGLASFRRVALFTAWRLADGSPLAARIAFGLSPSAELELNEMCPTEVARLADTRGVVRARWPENARFWLMLRTAAQSQCAQALQWAHCVGICLMDREPRQPGADGGQSGHGTLRR